MSHESIQQAYEAAYKKYALPLTQHVYHMLYSMGFVTDIWDIAQDITQDTFVSTFTSKTINTLIKNENHLRNSLYTTAEHKAIDHSRKARKLSSYDQLSSPDERDPGHYQFKDQADPIEATLPPIYNDELRRWIYHQLLKIHRGDREKADYVLFILDNRIDGIAWEQIARELGKNLSTVKKDWERSRGPLLAKLKDEGIL